MRDEIMPRPDLDDNDFPGALTQRNGVLVLYGYGIKVLVERGQLLITDGLGAHRRRGRFARATCGIERLVITGHSGVISLGAMRWLRDVDASFVQIDGDGRLLAISARGGVGDPRLRRLQALAIDTTTGLEVARSLMLAKIQGQIRVLGRIPNSEVARAAVENALARLESAKSPVALRGAEAEAGGAYWAAWSRLRVLFWPSEAKRVPEHWLSFEQRRSPITRSSRLAANPANAVLNYLYSLAEAEAITACLQLGLDPGIGFVHADHKNRNSLALDLMEVVRPAIDEWVLDLLSINVRSGWFHETREGVCRVLPPLSLRLGETAPTWAALLSPTAEYVAKTLAGSPGSRIRSTSTPLTQSNRRADWTERQNDQLVRSSIPIPTPPPAQPSVSVSVSMARLTGRRRSYGGEAARKRAESLAQRQQQAAEWEATAERIPDPSQFAPILAAIQGEPISELMRWTGLSRPYCEQIRRGLKVPHPMHWTALIGGVGSLGGADP